MADTGLAFFVYVRPEYTKMVLDSIRKNKFQKLYIFQDGLKNEKDRAEWNKVNTLIHSVDFIETELHVSEYNKGLSNSIVYGINYVLDRHNTVIALEDDIVLGSGYSDYMDESFDRYENDMNVYCVSGGSAPLIIPDDYEYDAFFSYRMSSAAWGTWRSRWKHYDRDIRILQRIFEDKEKKAIFDISGCDILPIYYAQIEGRADSWAIFWTLLQIDKKALCVIPVKYLAKDIGHSGVGGTNSTVKTTRFDTDLYDMPDNFRFPNNVEADERIMNSYDIIFNGDKNRDKSYIELLSRWVRSYQNNRYIREYFEKNNIKEVVIYGSGSIAELLINEIKNTLKIKCILVLDKQLDSFCGYPLYDFSDDLDVSGDTIIVTPVFDIEYIKHSLSKRFGAKNIIGLDEIC